MPYWFPPHKVCAARLLEALAYVLFRIAGMCSPRPKDPPHPGTILLVEPFHLGDVISLTSIIQPLRDLFPGARLIVLTQPKNADVLRYDARIADTITAPFPWATGDSKKSRGWLACWRALRRLKTSGGFDLGLDTRGELRSHLVMCLAGCRRRVGYTNYLGSNMRVRGSLLTDNVGDLPVMHRFLINREIVSRAFKTKLPAPVFPLFEPSGINPLCLDPSKPQVLLHPGAGSPHRLWEKEKWATLLRFLAQFPNLGVVLIGGLGDRDTVKAINALQPGPHKTCITTYPELLGLLKASALYVGMDSGPMNVAVSLGVPVVALFGPTDHQAWYPLGPHAYWISKFDEPYCDPGLSGSEIHPSLSRLSAAEVMELVKRALHELELVRPS